MAKYTSRHQPVISRNADESADENHWLNQFQKKLLDKDAVQSREVDSSLFDQINSIMNGKSKYPSVAAAVKDMQERSGLLNYLKKINKTSEEDIDDSTTKTASDNNAVIDKMVPIEKILPMVIKKCPAIKVTIENIVTSNRGNLSIPAILDRVRSIHQADVSNSKDWEDDKLLHFISKVNLEEKQKHPQPEESNILGKRDMSNAEDIDPSNNDAFFALNPAKNT